MSVRYVRIKPKTKPKGTTVFGYRVEFSRRRYANRHTYCWALLVLNDRDEWVSLGDPYPGVHWKRSELEKAVRSKLEQLGLEVTA